MVSGSHSASSAMASPDPRYSCYGNDDDDNDDDDGDGDERVVVMVRELA